MASAATSTTLPLFWHLSSNKKEERFDASAKLISALSQFQASHIVGEAEQTDVDAEDYEVQNARLDLLNAADVAYAIRRLIRGLASPRESSRLGFAVALTELLSRLDTVTCHQIINVVKNASQTSGGMSGQEERDMLFARLFGLKAIIESGLLVREQPMRSSSIRSSTLESFDSITVELIALGNKKSWLKETSWWTILSAVNALAASEVTWRDEALTRIVDKLFVQDKVWSAEKIALGLKLQSYAQSKNWSDIFGPHFKSGDLLSSNNLVQLARILKESDDESENSEAPKISHSGPWKAQLHFVWNVILDVLLASDASSNGATSGNLQDFYRIVVDENLFATSSTPNRKYWGFQVFQKILHRLPPSRLHVLFTPNFMRTWINHLSKSDRYLHKAAKQAAVDVQAFVDKEPTAGFALVLQLIGTNGSQNFDRVTRTKTVGSILAKMDGKGTDDYMNYLLEQFNKDGKADAFDSVDARRRWVIEQMSILLRRSLVSKNEDCVSKILVWLATNAFFIVSKKSSKSTNLALHVVPSPPLADNLHVLCRSKLLVCIAELTSVSFSTEKGEETKTSRSLGLASDGELWVTKTLKTITDLLDDKKHASVIGEMGERLAEVKRDVLSAIKQLEKNSGDRLTLQHGVEFLIVGLTLFCLCEGESEEDRQALTDAIEVSLKEFGSNKTSKKKNASKEDDDSVDRAPIDILVDIIIGLLENSTHYKRTIANQSFTMLTSLVAISTVDLILAQLQQRDPTQEVEDAIDSEDGSDDEDVDSLPDEDESEDGEEEGEESEEEDEDATDALREKLEALVPGLDDDSSDEVSMDDDQMMEIDEKLAEVFRTRVEERKKNKTGAQREATYFKNRVLDLVDIFLKREPTNPLVLRFVLPIVEIVSHASNDERQLAEKAAGIIRSRFSKPKEAPLISEETAATETLQKLHENARKAHSPETLSSINVCSLFIFRVLSRQWSTNGERIYEESITDYATRKGSSLNTAVFLDFVRRYPASAWHIRKSFLDSSKKAVNGFRQGQLFSCVQALVTTVIALPDEVIKKDDIIFFVRTALDTLQENLTSACAAEKAFLTAAQMKELLKTGVHLSQSAKRVATNTKSATITSLNYNAKAWDELRQKLGESAYYKTSPSLLGLCKQIFQILQSWNKEVSLSKPSLKRKGEAADDAESAVVIKAKRKKVRKTRENQKS